MTNHPALKAIAVGGLVAGTLDLTTACLLGGWNTPFWIAGGLIGPQAIHGGIPTYALGVLLHFFIAFSFTAFFYGASRMLAFPIKHPLISGIAYGIAIELLMSYVVMPLSALHAGGRNGLNDWVAGLLGHTLMVGLPISYIVRHFRPSTS